jgi:glyoxylate/hydroxypyruvate reductase
VAKRLAVFGCPISYFSRAPKPNFPSYKYFPSVLDLAQDSDVLVLSCALTDDTRSIINRDVMMALGKDGIIINVGRGALIDEPELVRSDDYLFL